MLEIIFVYSLCQKNAANAKAREKKPAIAVLYTILIWIGMEIYGLLLSGFIFEVLGLYDQLSILTYVIALGYAAIGGYISVIISKATIPIHPVIEPPSPFAKGKNGTNFMNRKIGKGSDDIRNRWDKY